jgi:hypothetical protein
LQRFAYISARPRSGSTLSSPARARPAKYTTLRIKKGQRLTNGALLAAFERTRAYRWRNHIIEEKYMKNKAFKGV